MSAFASRVRECRKRKGLTQTQIAKELGVAMRTFQDYERGERTPTFEGLQKLADFFEVSVDYLTGRTDDPHMRIHASYIDASIGRPAPIFWHTISFMTSSGDEITLSPKQTIEFDEMGRLFRNVREKASILAKELDVDEKEILRLLGI